MSAPAALNKRQHVVTAVQGLLLVTAVIGVVVGSFQAIYGSGISLGVCNRLSVSVQVPGPQLRAPGGAVPSFVVADPVAVASCIDTVLPNLPLVAERHCESAPHHWDARTGKWNEKIRFEPLQVKEASVAAISTVMYIGGNTNAADLAGLQKLLPGRPVHVLEPVPTFYAKLKRIAAPPAVRVHNLGLANSTRDVLLPKQSLKGQSTVVMNATAGGGGNVSAGASTGNEVLHLVSPADFLSRAGLDPARDQALLHSNCEGCEYEALLDGGVVRMFPAIQVSFHLVQEVPYRLTRYCAIRARLSETHALAVDMPFGWEQWVRRDLL